MDLKYMLLISALSMAFVLLFICTPFAIFAIFAFCLAFYIYHFSVSNFFDHHYECIQNMGYDYE